MNEPFHNGQWFEAQQSQTDMLQVVPAEKAPPSTTNCHLLLLFFKYFSSMLGLTYHQKSRSLSPKGLQTLSSYTLVSVTTGVLEPKMAAQTLKGTQITETDLERDFYMFREGTLKVPTKVNEQDVKGLKPELEYAEQGIYKVS